MTSVASETVGFSNRTTQLPRSQASTQAESDSPFALMLEASAPPPADPAPRRPEPSEPAAPSQKAEATADPKKKTKTDASDSKATESSEPAKDKAAAEDEGEVVQVEAGSDSASVEESLPEIPEMEETAEDGSRSAESEIVVVQVQAETVQPQAAVTPEVAVTVAAPAAVMPEAVAPASGDGDTAPELTIKPADAANVPAAKSAPEAPVAAPVIDTPELPAELQAKGIKDIPEIKGKAELKPAEAQSETAAQPVDVETQPLLPQQPKTEQARLHVQAEDAKPQQAESKPQQDTQQSAETAQHKPTLSLPTTANSDAANNSAPVTPTVVVPDAAATGASHARAQLVTASAVPVSGIAVEIATQAKAGNNRFEIRLDPPELGRIDVRLDVDTDGNVKSRLVIERADTYDLLRKDASTLERALQQAGLKTSDSGLEFTLRDQGSAQREARDQNQRNTERGIIPDADILPAEAASGYGRMLGLGGGVDIRI